MTTNPFFQNYTARGKQNVLDMMLIEQIQRYGVDTVYIPWERTSFDQIYYEDSQATFSTPYLIEMYLMSVNGYLAGTDGLTMSRGGYIDIADELIMAVSRTRFAQEIATRDPVMVRPREGDLVYFPVNHKVFQIHTVNDKPTFYQFGELQKYDLTLRLFEYSNEILNTGYEDIDQLQKKMSTNMLDYAMRDDQGNPLLDEHGNYIILDNTNQAVNDPGADNQQISTEANNVIDWTETNPFSNDGEF